MRVLGTEVAPLGMGCWPIGGAMFDGDAPLGYTGSDDAQSLRTLHAAWDAGLRVFDTAAAYGAGHAERLLAEAFKGRSDALIVTKIGLGIDEKTRQLGGPDTRPEAVIPAIEGCLRRLQRDCMDIVLLHLNTLPVAEAAPLFDQMERAREAGLIRGYGWSTDFSPSVRSLAGRQGAVAVEHAMNVFRDAPQIQATSAEMGLATLIRSPLAMGVLGGRYDAASQLPKGDIRATDRQPRYFQAGRVHPKVMAQLDQVREVLCIGGRTLTQGALGWLWARSEIALPVPGARTPEQIEESAGALALGPLPQAAMEDIEMLLGPRDRQEVER